MNIIIGDIGNTITKICIVDSKSYKIKKELRFDSKKLNTDIWYDENNMYWIKAFFKKKGKWEYKLLRSQ